MDLGSVDDGGGGKKMGLARLAKTCSLSSSLNNLNSIEKKLENKDDCNSLHDDVKSPEHVPESHQSSPGRTLSKQTGGVSLLPNKMNVSSLSGQQPSDKKSRFCSLDESVHTFESVGQSVPCSDPEFIKASKTGVRSSTGQVLVNQRCAFSVDKPPSIEKEPQSPLNRSRLSPPQIKRCSSMTRLSEAINQIHNICMFPAQPLVVTESSPTTTESSLQSPKSLTTCPPVSEVICSGSLTPLIATNCRDDKDRTQSSKLTRCSAFRKSSKEHRMTCTKSLFMPVVQPSECHHDSRTCCSLTLTSAPMNSSLKGSSSSLTNLLENDLCALIPSGTNFPLSSDFSKTSSSNRDCSCDDSLKMGKSRLIPKDNAFENFDKEKSVDGHKYIKKSKSSPSNLRHEGIATESSLKQSEERYQKASLSRVPEPRCETSRPVSWYGDQNKYEYQTSVSSGESEKKDYAYKPDDSPLQNCRSASLDELSNIHILPGLPLLSPADAKRRNYLFGGLGNGSLLGSKELDRYFPNRTLTIFIATWNMNGKEPPANLEEFLLPEAMEQVPDLYVVGTQESGGSRSEWEVRLQATIGPSHVLFTSAIFGVLHLTIFMRRDLLWFCSVPEEDTYSLRPGIAYKTKGGVAIGFQFFGTRLLFINSHLTAHEEKQALRVQNFRNICQSLDLPRLLPQKGKYKDVTQRYDCVFWLGDLNFRLAVNRDHVFERLKRAGAETYQHLLQWDQLYQARNKGEAFNDFEEGPITFAPTFKYDPGTDHYDTSSKMRVPSYTDRILFKSSRGSVTCTSYDSCPLFRTSDHKPVSGIFQCKIRPGKDDVPLAAGLFNRDVYLEAIRRRKRFMYQPALRNCPVQ